jgi:hypothetical protein
MRWRAAFSISLSEANVWPVAAAAAGSFFAIAVN